MLSEPFEMKADRDLCAMNEVALNNVVSEILNVIDPAKRDECIGTLREYGRWCIANRIDGFTIFLSRLERPDRFLYRSRFAANPMHLKQHLDDLFPRMKYPSVNDIYRCFLWMAFSGIPEQAAVEMASNQVDLVEMKISHAGNEFPIYAESAQSFYVAVNSERLIYNHPMYTKESFRDRAPGDKLLRFFTEKSRSSIGSTITKTWMNHRNSNVMKPQLNYRNIFYSGVFYRTFEQEMMGLPADFDRVIRLYFPLYFTGDTVNPNYYNKRRLYADGYKLWKENFVLSSIETK